MLLILTLDAAKNCSLKIKVNRASFLFPNTTNRYYNNLILQVKHPWFHFVAHFITRTKMVCRQQATELNM